MPEQILRGCGWERDLPDHRDYTPRHAAVLRLLDTLSIADQANGGRPSKVDRREYCGPVLDQGPLAASAAHACVGLVQYFGRFSAGRVVDPSRMFLHKAAVRLLDRSPTCATNLRSTLKALARFGLPPEKYCPYEINKLTEIPEPYGFSFAGEWQSLRYARLDPRGATGAHILETVQAFLAAGFPCAFGFVVTSGLGIEADIPFPTMFDVARGGQSVLAVGYDDNRRIRSEKGALLIRNSWGVEWGEGGYGWLPYAYVRQHLAGDFWTLLRPDWLESGEFARPLEAT